ncbi:HTH-type transcriptional repressor YvoA [Ruminiclostridium hungatei]|uniref:HTH-type transcriptional repressor YvoA n=1 Tax=Ruminiclostridium hungatei TaxID=48256 RepID=A0A1V4SQI3_RUMHU|nr:GntR family transcriptional regulator [Ruminiclostridium hungatei]OPX45715.1 HTH-type transcriptional repressor YvoA [Ruminiclostridium hungatei]
MVGMIPKYYLVKQRIVEMINNEEIGPDGMIPSERELMGSFGISRITAKKAIDDLVNEGYLYRIQGKGTFVKKDTLDQDLISITSCTQDIVRLGMTPSKRLLAAEVIEADRTRIKKLQLSNGEKVFKVKRVYYADNEPINLTTTYLPCKTYPLIETYDFGVASIYNILESKYNTRITKATRSIEAVLAVDEVARELRIKEGDPVLLFRAITYGMINGREIPIETFKSFYRSGKFKFYINQVHK